MVKKIKDYDSFLQGYKPALLLNEKQQYIPDKVKNYPSLQVKVFEIHQTLFFQNEKIKKEFIDNIRYIQEDSRDYHKILGLTLGFPPNSVEFFSALEVPFNDKEEERITVEYCGLNFVSSIYIIEDDLVWLWNKLNIDKVTKIRPYPLRNNLSYSIRFKELNSLKAVLEHRKRYYNNL